MPCDTKKPTFKICRCCYKWRCQCLIPRERKPHPPFNSGLSRNVKIGLHPKFCAAIEETPAVGTYSAHLPKTKADAIDWDKELESAEFSRTMGGKIVESYLLQKDAMTKGRGPGTHEIKQWPENVLEKECKTIKRDVGFGTVPLFEPSWRSTTPGPGYTRKNPYYYIDKRRHEGLSCVPTFEYDGGQPRFHRRLKSWTLPCNLYNAKDSKCMEAIAKKSTGKRGPYDLFTGPRDDTTIKGYFAKPKLIDNGGWPTALPNEIDKLLHKSNYFKGRWSDCPRFPKSPGLRLMLQDIALCYKDPKLPGPGHYSPKTPRKPTSTKKYAFDSNIEFIRPLPSFEIRPGPGRYNVKPKKSIPGHGWTFVFKSKAPRTKFITIPKYNAF